MTGTLAEKVERDVRAYPDDYRATGQWLDEFCSLKQHGSRLKGKLLLKKKEFDESGIQKEATKFKRKARKTGTKKAKEAAEKVARLCQSRKNDITKLKKQINTFQAYIENPKGKSPVANFVLIFEAWEYICSEEPQDIKKILLIFWLLTDRFVETTGPGLTRFEKWSYGDDRACADPREQFGTRHWTLEELLSRENQIIPKIIPMVEAAMRATTRNRETEQKVSGGKAGQEIKPDIPPAEEQKEKAKTIGSVNIETFTGILGDVQAENLQIGDNARIDKKPESEKPAETEQKVRSSFKKIVGWIFKKTSHFICAIFIAVIATIIAAIIVNILADFGWFERIKSFFTR